MKAVTWRHRGIVLALGLGACWPVLKVGFLWDDHFIIESNPTIRHWSVSNVRHDFLSTFFNDPANPDFYRPLQTFSDRVDYTLWGPGPVGFHATNLAIHLLNALLLLELALAIGMTPLAAVLSGCLFAVHPMIVSELMMIAGRNELLSFFFSTATLLCLLSSDRRLRYAAPMVFLLALLSKESSVMAPVQYLLILWLLNRTREAWRSLPGLAVAAGIYGLLYRSVMEGRISFLSGSWPWRFYWKAFPKVIAAYARLGLIPWNLYSDRQVPSTATDGYYYLALLIAALAVLVWKKNRWGLFCVGWFVLMLLPKTVVMMSTSLMLDHWIYPSLPGLLFPLAVFLAQGWVDAREGMRGASRVSFGALAVFWAFLIHFNVAVRGTDEKLFRWATRFPASETIRQNLGWVLLKEHRPEEAARYLPPAVIQEFFQSVGRGKTKSEPPRNKD